MCSLLTLLMGAALGMNAFDGAKLNVDYPAYMSQFGVVYKRPPARGCDGPLMGNGDLGAVVFFPNNNTVRLVLNKTDAWVSHDLKSVLALEYELSGAEVESVETRLHIEDARITTKLAGNGWELWLEMFVDALTNRLLIRSQGRSPEGAEAVIRIGKDWGEGLASVELDGDRCLALKHVDEGDLHVAVALQARSQSASVSKKGCHSIASWRLKRPSEFLFVLCADTGKTRDEVIGGLDAALKEGFDSILEAHRGWWAEFWPQSFVQIDEGWPANYHYLTHLYYLNLYNYACSFRGKWAPPFEGGLWTWERDRRMWVGPGASYWHWNQAAAVCALDGCGHPELLEPYLNTFFGMLDEAKETAQKYFGLPGAVFREVHRRDGLESAQGSRHNAKMASLISPGPQMAAVFYDHYLFTRDEKFLKEKAYPMMREVVRFLLAYAGRDEEGRLHLCPSSPYEHGPEEGGLCDATQSLFALRACLKYLLEADQILHVAAAQERREWEEAVANLAAVPTLETEEGTVFTEARDSEGNPVDGGVQFTPEYGGLWPLMLIEPGTEEFKIALNTYRHLSARQFHFPFNTSSVVAARLGLREEVRNVLAQELALQLYTNGLFSYLSGRWFEERPRAAQNPYLESSGLFMSAIQESLLQSHGGIIRLFPATSVAWMCRFKLNARGGFVVTSEKRWNEAPRYVLVESRAGGTCKLLDPWDGKEVKVIVAGAASSKVPFTREDSTIQFATKTGATYLIEPARPPRTRGKAARITGAPPQEPITFGPRIGQP